MNVILMGEPHKQLECKDVVKSVKKKLNVIDSGALKSYPRRPS